MQITQYSFDPLLQFTKASAVEDAESVKGAMYWMAVWFLAEWPEEQG
jgi:hypothetical protein